MQFFKSNKHINVIFENDVDEISSEGEWFYAESNVGRLSKIFGNKI